jgi:tRNA (guanine37-N1)-methyltransferase
MKIKVLTGFPDFVESIKEFSIIKQAIKKEKVDLDVYNLHDWGKGNYSQIDDRPYGGGPGMVLMIEPIYEALQEIRTETSYVVLTSAKGNNFDYKKSKDFSLEREIIIICGHYEGVDARVLDLVNEEIRVGDVVTSGGEIPAMMMIDAVARLIPGVINQDSLKEETNSKVKEYPHYTRPYDFNGLKVPEILKSGDHGSIEKWRKDHTENKK